MKIDNSMAREALATYQNTANAARAGASASQPASVPKAQAPDSAEISAHGRQFAQALDAVRQSPDTRAELVSSLRQQVQTGTYTVNGQQLADKIAPHIDVGA